MIQIACEFWGYNNVGVLVHVTISSLFFFLL